MERDYPYAETQAEYSTGPPNWACVSMYEYKHSIYTNIFFMSAYIYIYIYMCGYKNQYLITTFLGQCGGEDTVQPTQF